MGLAIRRSLYRPFAPGSANDDTTPMIWATLNGMRSVWDPKAMAFEKSGQSFREEFRRRIRIGAGNFQTLSRYCSVLNPKYGIAAYTFGSHKVLRWLGPFLLIGALITNVLLFDKALYVYFLYAQVAVFAIAAVGGALVSLNRRLPPITSLFHFIAMNAALLLGFFRFLKQGNRKFIWEPTART
jgi:cellulose synthase/poly-beta-1,6-N-acetylglucosamine synthase-like glycosyltransferase